MIIDDQNAVVGMLREPATYRLVEGQVDEIETHISHIFLAGDKAYKMKRAVKLPYVDFSTADKRLAACEREIELNGHYAPEIYLGVRRIVRDRDGGLHFDGKGELVDAVVEMRRFDQSRLLDRMAMSRQLTPALMTEVARMVEHFHRDAFQTRAKGGAANMSAVLNINEAAFATSNRRAMSTP